MAKFKIGCQTLAWKNFFKDCPMKNVLWEIRQADYEGVECCEPLFRLGPMGLFKMEIEEEGLQLASLSSNVKVSGDEEGDLKEAMERVSFASHFGVRSLVTMGGWVSDGLNKDQKSYKALGRRIDSLAAFASKFDIKIAFHNHLNSIVEDERDILNLLEFSNSAKLCLDTGHLIAAGSEPCEAIKRFSASVAHVHLKDWDPAIKDFVELGRGVLKDKFKNILAALTEYNYTDWVIVELDRASGTPFESAKISRDFLREMEY